MRSCKMSRKSPDFGLTCSGLATTLETQKKKEKKKHRPCTTFSGHYVRGQRREMNVPSSQHPDKHIREAVASMAGGWKATLLKFGATLRSRVHVGDTFSVPLVSFQPNWPTFPTLWPDSLFLSLRCVPSVVCVLLGFLRISKLAILRFQERKHVWMCWSCLVDKEQLV